MSTIQTLMLSVLFVAASAGDVYADIFACANSDGSTDYTNVQPPGRRCRRIVEGTSAASSRRASSRRVRPRRRSRPSDTSRFQRYDGYIAEAAALYQLPIHFLRAIVKAESNFNPGVVSGAGAAGLMQLMPRTAASMGVRDPFDPRQNIFGGARYLRVLANRFSGDLVLTVAAYNAGPGAVERYRGVPPYAETQRYVRRVLGHYYRLRSGGAITSPR